MSELRLDGPVVLIQANDDPGDMGEPRQWSEDGIHYVVVPSFALWPSGQSLRSDWTGCEMAERMDELARSDPPTYIEVAALTIRDWFLDRDGVLCNSPLSDSGRSCTRTLGHSGEHL